MSRRSIVRALMLVFAVVPAAQAQVAPSPPAAESPLTLRRVVELALQRAPQLGEARAARDEAAASADLAKDQLHPYALFTTSPGYTYGMPSTIVGRVPAVVGVEIRTAIYDPTRRSGALQAEATQSSYGASLESSCRGAAE